MDRLGEGILASFLLASLLTSPGCGEKSEDCPSGLVRCGVACIDPAAFPTDPLNCGACGVVCGIGTCVGGVCQCEGATFCAGLNPLCRDLQGDAQSCGSCGRACALANAACVGGACQCPAALPDACPAADPTRCVSLLSSPTDCGTCGHVCPLANDVCVGGQCQCPESAPLACPAGAPARCVDPATDEANCGGCGVACAAGGTCTAGSCACPGAQAVCGEGSEARCVDLETDEANCGTCGRSCPAGATCTSADCACPAAEPLVCGTTAPTCCAGVGCCGAGCQTVHSNGIGVPGLGQSYFDCNPLGTYGASAAASAARAWRTTPSFQYTGLQVGCPTNDCLGWQTADACAVWCYGNDALRGRVSLNTLSIACVCPSAGPPNWN